MIFLSKKRLKKSIALWCVFSILFPSFTVSAQSFFKFREFFSESSATTSTTNNSEFVVKKSAKNLPTVGRTKLISILVQKSLLENRDIKTRVERYARDAQTAIGGQAIVVPVTKKMSPYEIWEGNAALYASGLAGDQKSQLVGTVLIGAVPIPVVEKNEALLATPFPYTDFENTNYIWDNAKNRFVFQSGGDSEPEIWHGVIQSDFTTGDAAIDKKLRANELIDYFDQNHLFHEGKLDYAKKVFHADLLIQKTGLPTEIKDSYYGWLDSLEDIIYQRYTQSLAQQAFDDMDIANAIPIDYLSDDVFPDGKNSPNIAVEFDNLPDILSKSAIESMIRRYFENYEGYLSQTHTKIGVAGRWDPADIDTTITLVSQKDEKSADLLKSFNDEVEEMLFDQIQTNGFDSDISVIQGGTLTEKTHRISLVKSYEFSADDHEDCSIAELITHSCDYIHFPFFWNGVEISTGNFDVDNCSLLRGGGSAGQMVEFNRTLNIANVNEDEDSDSCEGVGVSKCCGLLVDAEEDFDGDNEDDLKMETSQCRFDDIAFFPLYFDTNEGDYDFYKSATGGYGTTNGQYDIERIDLFDVSGAAKVDGVENILLRNFYGAQGCHRLNWDVQIDNTVFDDTDIQTLLDANTKDIASLSNHVEPTPATIKAQMDSLLTSSAKALPVDSPRGFSFYNSDFTFLRINYPNAFSLREESTELAEAARKTQLKADLVALLDNKLTELNDAQVRGTATALASDFFDSLWNTFDQDQLVDAIVWLDKPLEQKNIDVFLGGLSSTTQGRNVLLDNNFDGYEVMYIRGEAAQTGEIAGMAVDFERGEEEASQTFLQAQLANQIFDYETVEPINFDAEKNSESAVLDFDFPDETPDECDRSLLKWPGSCLVPWLKDLPKAFQSFTEIIPSSDKKGLQFNKSSSSEKNPPKIYQLNLEPSSINISAASTTPIELKVSAWDENNDLMQADFSSEVILQALGSDFSRFFRIAGADKKTLRDGKTSFFLTPKTSTYGGNFSINITAGSNLVTRVPVKVHPTKIIANLAETDLIAGGSATELELSLTDLSGKISRDYDGETVVLVGEGVSFSPSNKIKISDGRAQATITPGKKSAEKITINLQSPTGAFPEKTISLQIKPNVAEKIVLNNPGEVLVAGGGLVHVSAKVTDQFGNVISDKTHTLKFFAENSTLIPTKAGAIELTPPTEATNVQLEISSSALEQKPITHEFVVTKNPQIFLNTESKTLTAGDKNMITIPIKALSQTGQLLKVNTELFVKGASGVGNFSEKISLVDGRGVFQLAAGTVAGKNRLIFSGQGFVQQKFNLEVEPAPARKIEIIAPTKEIDSTKLEPTDIVIKVFDAYGNLATGFSEAVYVRLNPPDDFDETAAAELSKDGILTDKNKLKYLQDNAVPKELADFYATFVDTDPVVEVIEEFDTNFYAAEVQLSKGVGTIELTPQGTSGRLYLLVEKPEVLVADTEIIELTRTLVPADFNFLAPKSVLTLLLGLAGGDLVKPNLGNRFLFSGRTQAVATSLLDPLAASITDTLQPTGEFSAEIVPRFQFGDLAEIGFEKNRRIFLETKLVFSDFPKIRFNPGAKAAEDENAVVITSTEDQVTFKNRTFLKDDTPLLLVNEWGGVKQLDAGASLVATGKNFLEWHIVYQGATLGLITFNLENNRFIEKSANTFQASRLPLYAAISFSATETKKFPAGIVYEKIGVFSLAEEFSGQDTNDPKALVILDAEQVSTANSRSGFSTVSVEDAFRDVTVGWDGNWKPATLLGAGNTVGESLQYGASDDLVVLGDPTARITETNRKTNLNITEDLGKIIWKSPTGNIDQILTGDLNADEESDVFVRTGEELFLLYQDPQGVDNFRDVGPVLRFGDGVKMLARYQHEQALVFIIQLNEQGELVFHKNENGRFVRQDLELDLPVITDIKVGNVNADAYEDLVLLTENNRILFVHGKDGKSFQSAVTLYDFAPEFESIQTSYKSKDVTADDLFNTSDTPSILSQVLVHFSNITTQIRTEDNNQTVDETEFFPLSDLSSATVKFSAEKSGNAQVQIGQTVDFELQLNIGSHDELTLLVPEFDGQSIEADSFRCTGCEVVVGTPAERYQILLSGVKSAVTLTWSAQVESFDPIEFTLADFSGNDGIDDVAIPVMEDDEPFFIQFLSSLPGKTHPRPVKILDQAQANSFLSAFKKSADFLKAQVFNLPISTISQTNATFLTHKKVVKKALPDNNTLLTEDADFEAIGEDVLANLPTVQTPVEAAVKALDCTNGCGNPIPSFVFTAPGQQSLYLPPIGVPGLPSPPVPMIGMPALQITPMPPFVIPFAPSLPVSLFRLFTMPTTNGGLGLGVCVGPPTGFSIPPLPIGNCFVTSLPLLELAGVCPSNLLNTGVSPALENLMPAFNTAASQSTYELSPKKAVSNIKLVSADIITDWVRQQFEEFGNFKFPNINFILPSDFGATPINKTAELSERLASSPFIKTETKPIKILYPDISSAQINQLKKNWNNWKSDYQDWKCEGSVCDISSTLQSDLTAILALIALKEQNSFLKNTYEQVLADLKKEQTFTEAELAIVEEALAADFAKNVLKNSEDLTKATNEIKALESPDLQKLSYQIAADTQNDMQASLRGLTVDITDIDISGLPTTPTFELGDDFSKKFAEKLNEDLVFDAVEKNINTFDENVTKLTGYQEFAKNIKAVPQVVDQTLSDVETTTQVVNNYFGQWLDTNNRNLKEWENFQTDLGQMFTIWSSIPEIFQGMESFCTRCNVNRGSLLGWLFNLLLGGIKLPIIKMPKLPDITVNLAEIGIGFEVEIPQIELQGVAIDISKLPSLPQGSVQMVFDVTMITMAESFANVDWEQGFALPSKKISKGLSQKITKALTDKIGKIPESEKKSADFSRFDLSEFEVMVPDLDFSKTIHAEFSASFEGRVGDLLEGIDIGSIPGVELVLSDQIPTLPDLPTIDMTLQSSLALPALQLPLLPVILAPPILPTFLDKIQKIIQIPKPLFKMLCFFLMGYLPVPEWKVASTVQEMTNRTDLIALDLIFGAQTKINQKPAPAAKEITFEKTYFEALNQLTEQLESVQQQSACVVDQIATGTVCEVATKKVAEVPGTQMLTYRYEPTQEMTLAAFQADASMQEGIQRLETLLANQGETPGSKENTQKILAKIKPRPVAMAPRNLLASNTVIDLKQIPKYLPSTLEAEDIVEDQAKLIVYRPKMNFYDPKTDFSESITTMSLVGKSYTFVTNDLDFDQKREILYALDGELYLKRRYQSLRRIKPFRTTELERLTEEDFQELYAPSQTITDKTSGAGAQLRFSRETTNDINYYEWRVSDRPDHLFEHDDKPVNRVSSDWKRVGFLVRDESRKYQIRSSTAQIVSVKGNPVLIGGKMKPVQRFDEIASCEDKTQLKPFYPAETILVSKEDRTTFKIVTKERNGQEQKSYWKTMNAGEETFVDFAEVCLVSGSLEEVEIAKEARFVAKRGDYFASGMRLELGEKDSVTLRLYTGRKIVVLPNQTYEIQHFLDTEPVLKKFKKLATGNYYGILEGFSGQAETPSYRQTKMLHDPQNVDDTQAPIIRFEAGQKITVPVMTPIRLNASATFDDIEIDQIVWDGTAADLDLSNEHALVLELPAQKNPRIFSVKLLVTDKAGNSSEALVEVSVVVPDITLTEASFHQKRIQGRVDTTKIFPVTVWRERNKQKSPVVTLNTLENGAFFFEVKNQNIVEFWQKNPRKKVIEILPTGRPVLLDTTYAFEVITADTIAGTKIELLSPQRKKIGEIFLNTSADFPVEIHKTWQKNFSTEKLQLIAGEKAEWQKIVSTKTSLKNTWALIETNAQKAVGLFRPESGFQFAKDYTGTLALRPTFSVEESVGIQIFDNKKTLLGTFTFPPRGEVWATKP